MTDNIKPAVPSFEVEIDGKPHSMHSDLESAKNEAISISNGVSSMMITSLAASALVASCVWVWDYAINDWVFSQNASFANANRKDQQNC